MKKPRPANRIGRKRRAAGWTLLALGLLVAVVWVASGWTFPYLRLGPFLLGAGAGRFDVVDLNRFDEPIRKLWPAQMKLEYATHRDLAGLSRWVPQWQLKPHWHLEPVWKFTMTFWPLPLLLLTTGGLALWSGRRARRRVMTNHCPTCGYNLAGLGADAKCPECGKGAVTT